MTATIAIPDEVLTEVVATRRDLHVHPELGFEEHRTAAIVAERLRALGYEVTTGIGGTGVVGVLEGGKPGRTVMLRADMDALPLDEENDVPYRSQTVQTMHACGHDGHVAMLLGAARTVMARRAEVAGTVCFLFQPAEEGKGGAKAMIEDGVLERFGIERAYGLHLASAHPAGQVGFREGPFYASSDSIEITVEGKGGHGAAPHLSVDPVYVASQFVVAVQQVVSRNIDPIEPAVVTIGAINGGTTHNVIPSRVRLLGTVRAFDAERARRDGRAHRARAARHLRELRRDVRLRVPVALPGDLERRRADALRARARAARRRRATRVADVPKLMGAEDFSFFAERVPACFFTVGSNGGPASGFPHHHARFDIDESALETGVRMMTALALDAPAHAP